MCQYLHWRSCVGLDPVQMDYNSINLHLFCTSDYGANSETSFSSEQPLFVKGQNQLPMTMLRGKTIAQVEHLPVITNLCFWIFFFFFAFPTFLELYRNSCVWHLQIWAHLHLEFKVYCNLLGISFPVKLSAYTYCSPQSFFISFSVTSLIKALAHFPFKVQTLFTLWKRKILIKCQRSSNYWICVAARDDYTGRSLPSSLGCMPCSFSKQIFSTELKYVIASQRLFVSTKALMNTSCIKLWGFNAITG